MTNFNFKFHIIKSCESIHKTELIEYLIIIFIRASKKSNNYKPKQAKHTTINLFGKQRKTGWLHFRCSFRFYFNHTSVFSFWQNKQMMHVFLVQSGFLQGHSIKNPVTPSLALFWCTVLGLGWELFNRLFWYKFVSGLWALSNRSDCFWNN